MPERRPARPVPAWCLPTCAPPRGTLPRWHGGNFRRDAALSPERATALVPAALGLGKQGQKSAFRTVRRGCAADARLQRSEVADHSYREVDGEMRRNRVGPARERQLRAHAKRLWGGDKIFPRSSYRPRQLPRTF